MKKYKSLIISSLVMSLIISVPALSFAENEVGYRNDTENTKQETRSNSLFNRVLNFFGTHKTSETVKESSLSPVISGIKSPTMLGINEVGTWTVKASDPSNGSLNYSVDWGDSNSVAGTKAMQQAFVQTSTFTHSYSNKGEYKIIFTVTNDAGLKTTSSVTVHVVGQVVNSTPVISNLSAISVKPNKATIIWATDVRANSSVWYSTTSPVNTSISPNVSRNARVLKHKIVLNNLVPNTKYYLIVGSNNNAGSAVSQEISFTTPNTVMNNTPVITSLSGPTSIKTGETETVTVNAYDPKNSDLSYTVDWGDNTDTTSGKSLSARPIFNQTTTFSHIYNQAGTYTATFTVENNAGNKSSATLKIEVTN